MRVSLTVLQPLFSTALYERHVLAKPSTAKELLAVKFYQVKNKTNRGVVHSLLWRKMQNNIFWDFFSGFSKDCSQIIVMCVCCRSLMPFRRAMLHQHCGGSSVWAMLSCSVPLSSSWGECFSWPQPCSSWMTGKRPRNSKWLRRRHHCFIYYLVIPSNILELLEMHATDSELQTHHLRGHLCRLTLLLLSDVCQGQAAQQ